MGFSFIKPGEALQPYVRSFWILESATGLPSSDLVPDGRARIVIPCENTFTWSSDEKVVTNRENEIFLAGVSSIPRTIRSPKQETRTIGIELSPKGLYHFFTLDMHELSNQICSFHDLFGVWGKRLQHELMNIERSDDKIAFLQNALTYQLNRTTDYALIDYAVDRIVHSHGILKIRSLEAEIGYSHHYLDILFKKNIGVSPKTLARIMRFQRLYKLWAKSETSSFPKGDLYQYYFDESHFIKEFKRFTRYSPGKYLEISPGFNREFYSH